MSPDPELATPADESGWVYARPMRAVEVLQRLIRLPALIVRHADLVRTTLRRDISARFHGTLLGWAWPVLQPLFLFTVYYFIFTRLLQIRMPNLPEEQQAGMGVYMFCAMVAWTALAESLSRGTTVIVDNGNLIKKLAFPSELLPLNTVLASIVMMLFAVVIFVLAALFTPMWPSPGLELAWVPLIVALQTLFCYGLVLLLSTLQVFLRDTVQFVSMAVTMWMFLTPIFWVPDLVGDAIEPYRALIEANPGYHLVSAWRGALMGDVSFELGGRVMNPVSVARIPEHVAVFSLWALGAYVVGYGFFVLSQRRFADEV